MMDYPKDLSDYCLAEKTDSFGNKWSLCNSCPFKKTRDLIGSRWSLLIVKELHVRNGPLRYNEFLHALKPISSRSLSLNLKKLIKHDIVGKKFVSASPPYVEYNLTDKGKEFGLLLIKMAKWSFKWDYIENK